MNAETLFVFPNHGIGDSIICNGMCRVLSKRERGIVWVAGSNEAAAIRSMFSDLPNVQVLDGVNYTEAKKIQVPGNCKRLGLGYFSEAGFDWDPTDWDSEFYNQAGMNYSERWDSFSLPAALLSQEKVNRGAFALLHEIPERQIMLKAGLLPEIPLLRIAGGRSFWDWLPDMLAASELHFVDSSYLNLAESLFAMGFLRDTKLVFHRYAKVTRYGSVPPQLRAPWEIL